MSKLELFYYVAGIASVLLGYYFNNQYVLEYAPHGGLHNFIWGPGSWSEFIALGYDNPAASSASQDYTIMSPICSLFCSHDPDLLVQARDSA